MAGAVELVDLGREVSNSSNEARLGASSGRRAAISQRRKQVTACSVKRGQVKVEQAH